jgi:hypothetical protein
VQVTNIKANDAATGVMTIASSVLTTTDINGGTIDGVTIGGASAGAGTFTSVTGTSLDMNGSADFAGNINLSQASNTTIKRDDNTGFLSIQGGTDALSTSLVMYGNAHATLPNWTILEADTMVFRTVDNTDFMRFVDGTGAVFNENGADLDFRIESDTNTHAFFLQGSDGNVGIGTSSPESTTHIAEGEATAYNGAATDGQLSAGSTLFVQQTSGSNTAVSQLVFQPRSGFPYNRIVNSGGSAPFMAFGTNNAERIRITRPQAM